MYYTHLPVNELFSYLIFCLIWIVINFIIIRLATRATGSSKLLGDIYKVQNKQMVLLEQLVNKLGGHVTEDIYYQTDGLSEIKKYSSNDLFLPDGSLNIQLAERFAILYQQHCKALKARDCKMEDGVAMFNHHIDELMKGLNNEHRAAFFARYQMEKMVFRE